MEELLNNGPLSFALVLLVAFALDLAAGDPEWFPHPVRLTGKAIVFIEGVLRRFARTPLIERLAGFVLAVFIVIPVYAVTAALLYYSFSCSAVLSTMLSILIVWMSISIRSLRDEAGGVARAMRDSGVEAARERLSRIVGRDTAGLGEEDVLRAASETVAENTSDGIVAPLFYLLIGGPPLMAAYKAVNTLDSMVGYRNERYRYFGSFPARLDDLVNYVPSRLTAMLMVVSSFMLGYDWRSSLRVLLRDGGNHPSPNSGRPEAAVAGALGLRFGGGASYGGHFSAKPFIGDGSRDHSVETLDSSVRIMVATSVLMAALVLFFRSLAIFML